MRIVTDDIEKDWSIKNFANAEPVEMIYRAKQGLEQRKMAATGIPAVLSGMGDPVLKSGGGTGSTIALIEQAGKKFGAIDKGVRRDLTGLYSHTLDLLAQYGSIELYAKYAAPEDLRYLQMLKAIQPGTSISDLFSLIVEAPSASNNREMQKQNALVVWKFIQDQSQIALGLAQQIFPQMNPAALIPYMVQWANLMNRVGQEVIDLNELPGCGTSCRRSR